MASTQALSAAAQDRKTRLAQLKSLKRKQPSADADSDAPDEDTTSARSTLPSSQTHAYDDDAADDGPAEPSVTTKYLSGRNYDAETKSAKLGFENAPSARATTTLEAQAASLATETQHQAAAEAEADKPLDLFALQPKKANWDLKRDLDRKLEVLNVRTDNAIARLVRERIAAQKRKAEAGREANGANGEGDMGGLEGAMLVEATNVREREDEEEARRERAEEDALLDAT